MTGGGIINRKSISILLLLLTIALPLNVGAISAAATSQTNTDQKTSPVCNKQLHPKHDKQKTSNTTNTSKSQVSTKKFYNKKLCSGRLSENCFIN